MFLKRNVLVTYTSLIQLGFVNRFLCMTKVGFQASDAVTAIKKPIVDSLT